MISASELRIGNWVDFGEEKDSIYAWPRFDKITSIGEKMIDGTQRQRWYLKFIEPIPLTPEILVKCGFEKYMGSDKWEIQLPYGEHYICFFAGSCYTGNNEDSYYEKECPVKSLHQLQNLYYALTGTELIYTP